MVSAGRNQFYFTLFTGLVFSLTLVSNTFAHSGHKHDKPPIDLPEVTAQVNGTDIKRAVVLRELKKTIRNYKKKGMTLTADQLKTAAKMSIQDEIGRTLLIQKGKEIGVNISPEAVQKKLDAVKSSFKSDAVFEHKLADQGLTLERYREELTTDLILDAVIKKEIEPGVEISPTAIKEYYQKNKAKYQNAETRRASVILIKFSEKQGAAGERAARNRIDSIIEQLKSGNDFEDMAKKFSHDSLAGKGGDLGYFKKGKMLPAFSERAYKMKTGEVSEPFKTAHGFHILKLTDIKPAGARSLEETQAEIKKSLVNKKLAQETQAYMKGLREKAEIKTYF